MAGMGPPPKADDQRRRRNATVAMTRLPADGRPGPAPEWPLIADVVLTTRHELAVARVRKLESDMADAKGMGNPTGLLERRLEQAQEKAAIMAAQLREQRTLETELWRELWALPQAVQWERLGWKRDVAQYVRHKVMAELGDLDGAREARQWSDRLGLSPMAMLRLRWEVTADEVGQRRDSRTAAPKSARARLKVVDAGAVAGA